MSFYVKKVVNKWITISKSCVNVDNTLMLFLFLSTKTEVSNLLPSRLKKIFPSLPFIPWNRWTHLVHRYSFYCTYTNILFFILFIGIKHKRYKFDIILIDSLYLIFDYVKPTLSFIILPPSFLHRPSP